MPTTVEVPTFIIVLAIVGVVVLLMQKDKTVRYMRKVEKWKRVVADECEYMNEQIKREESQIAELN